MMSCSAVYAQRSRLVVDVVGARSSAGQVIVCLYDQPEGFPSNNAKALTCLRAPLQQGAAQVVFADLKPGTYALSVLHDENHNGKMEVNWLGIPREGYGASNDARGRMGPPRFTDAQIVVPAEGLRHRISLIYY